MKTAINSRLKGSGPVPRQDSTRFFQTGFFYCADSKDPLRGMTPGFACDIQRVSQPSIPPDFN